MSIYSSPLFNRFPQDLKTSPGFWYELQTYEFDRPSFSKRPVDFAVRDPARPWQEIAHGIFILIAKIVIFPWGLYRLAKYITQRSFMIPIYPAQSRLVKIFFKHWRVQGLQEEISYRKRVTNMHKFLIRYLVLEKNGIRYSALLLAHQDTLANGKWVLQATGNSAPIESFTPVEEVYRRNNFNTLLVNGPAVGNSQGQATLESMGDAQEIGIQFLETALKARKIILAADSIGRAALGEAILKHDFKPDIKYLVISRVAFDRLSNIPAKVLGKIFKSSCIKSFIRRWIQWANCEMDTVPASRKLASLGITEVIVQASRKKFEKEALPHPEDFADDGVIPAHGCLGRRLIKEGITQHKIFIGSQNLQHQFPNEYYEIAEVNEIISRFSKA